MKIIDKLIIIALGLFICFNVSWKTPIVLFGLVPIIYSVIYLILKGVEDEFND